MPKVIRTSARDMENTYVYNKHFTVYYTIKCIMPCCKVFISLLPRFHALNLEQLRLSENLKSGLPAYLTDGRLVSFGPNEH